MNPLSTASQTSKATYLKDYQAPGFIVHTLHLVVDIHRDETRITNTLVLEPTQEGPLTLDGVGISLTQIAVEGKVLQPSEYTLTPDALLLKNLPKTKFTIVIHNTFNPKTNTTCTGFYQSGTMLCTQCESHGFRHITYMLDRPDVMTSYTTEMIADKDVYPTLLSNGNLIHTADLPHHRHSATWHDPHKKPSYLFAMVAGKLAVRKDTFVTHSGRSVQLEIYTDAQDIAKTEYAMGSLKRAMRWDETRFGREYDLDIYMIVAAAEFNMGAMENKGLNIFNTKYVLADDNISTDQDFQHVEAVIGHEYFHNWTGNRITCRDWFQLTLKEGLTVFRDQEFTSDLHDRTVKRIEDVKLIRNQQFAEDASPMAHPIQPQSYIEMNNFYTVTVYHKGAEVIRMQYTLAGHAGFRRGMDLYFERHDGQAVTCDDFIAAIADANHLDLSQFKRWYHQAGTPKVTAAGHYDSSLKRYTLTLSQHTPPTADRSPKAPFVIPVKMGLLSATGQALKIRYRDQTSHEHLLVLDQETQSFVLEVLGVPEDTAENPIPSLLRDFSAPVHLSFEYSDAALGCLMSHDENLFNRWDAGQRLATRTILGILHQGQQYSLAPLTHAYGQLLANSHQISPDFLAEALQLPTLAALLEQLSSDQTLDIDLLIQAHQAIEQHLARAHGTDFLNLYDAISHQPSAKNLKNTVLAWLMVLEKPAAQARAKTQYQQAQNMTERLGAFKTLSRSREITLRDQTLIDFYQKFESEALVIDKWLAMQASNPHSGTLERVKLLAQHPVLALQNPNKVHALIGTFGSNLYQFHEASGKGYDFMADQVIALNKNPQVAARMVRHLMNFKRFDASRQQLMRRALKKILDTPDLAKDVFEIVSKSLES